MHPARDAELAGEVDSRLAAADVELVDGGEIARIETVGILARRLQCVEDRPLRTA
jgi:hypothetical protein